MINTTMPLTSAYSQHQNISNEMNIYIHQETKSTNGNTIHIISCILSKLVIYKKKKCFL